MGKLSQSYLKELAKKKKFGQEGLEKKEDDRIVVPGVLQDDKDFYYKFMQSPRYNAMLEGKHYTPFTRFTDLTYSENPIYSGRKERGNIRSKMWSIADAPYLIGTLQKHPQSAADREDFRQKRLPIESAEYIKNARLQNLEEKNPDIYTYPSIEQFVNRWNGEGLAPSGFSEFKTGDIYMNPFYYEGMKDIDEDTRFNILRWLPAVRQVETHELSHTIDRPRGGYEHLIPIEDITAIKQKTLGSQQKFLDEDKYDRWKYLSTPTEVRARLNVVRKALNDKGIDIGTKTIEPEDLESLKDTDVSDLNDLRDILKEEDIIWMLNNISKNETPQKEKYAKSGAYIPTEDKQFSVKKSTIPGANKGLFSKTPIKQGKLIGLAHENNQPVGTLGNMHNHSETPNMQSVKVGNQRYVYATRDIQPGEELTTNYRLQPELEQPEDFMGNKRFGQKGFYKPDFRTKSQIVNAQGQQRENTYVKPVVKNAAQLQRINQIQEQERQRRIQKAADKVQGTLRETNDADREAMNREDYTLLGRAQKLGRGDFNPLVLAAGAADLINPAAYWYTGKDVARGIGQTAQGIVNLDPEQIGSGLLQTTLSGLTLLPATSGFKPALKQAGKYLTQTPLRNIFKGPFKSEINWGNWNAEIPKNKTLMREYKDIERTTKQAGTWMKNPDGTPFTLPDGTPGTAEQFVQMQSQNFKKAFPKGFDLTYRGGQVYNPMLGGSSKGWDNVDDIDPNFILFGTDNRSVAERYATNYGYGFDESFQAKGIHPSFYHPDVSKTIPYNTRMFGMNPLTDVGLYGYATPKNAQKLISNANKQRWMNVENSEVMEWLKRINPEEYKLRTLDKEWLPDKVTTDNIAKYIKEKNIPIAEIKNVHDGADYFGNFVPSNVRAINRSMINPKSLWYNSGMFDMTNPNIYKGVLPYALPIGAGLGTGYMMQNQKPKGTYQGGGTMLAEPDYDIYKAPKQGNYLLPDINRPYYTDEQGGNRSEYKMGFNINGKETLLPTVVGGRQLTPEEAINRYHQTGLHMGQYNTPEEAEYAARLRTAKYNMLQDPVRFNASMFQMGGTMGIPGVNGQVVSSGPTPLTSVKKTRGPMSMDNKGNVKTMPTKAVKKILKNIK